tara:strand:- start:473 stop:1042 length:570 start_codon:yes stop_codon:yes gene_type:complete
MSDPITTGIGIGLGTSLLTGGDPLRGAALGGLGGGAFGAFQPGGFASGMFGSAPAAGTVAGGSTFAPAMLGQSAMNPALLGQTVTPSLLSGKAGGALSLNAFDKIGNAVNSVTAPFENFAAENPFLSRVGGNVLANQIMGSPTPQMQPNPLSQIPILPGRESVAGRVTGLRTTPQPLAGRNINFGGYQG